jgi:lysozyme family protein
MVSHNEQHPTVNLVWSGDNGLGVSFRKSFIEDIMSFGSALRKTLHVEGGLSLDPNDSGNWTGGAKGKGELRGTNYGISAAQYPNEDIANLSTERATFLYKRDYWTPLKLDEVRNETLQEKMFDMGVNMGIDTAAIILQRTINFLQPGEQDIDVDGIIGPQTLAKTHEWLHKNDLAFWITFKSFRFMRYFEIIQKNPRLRGYRFSWLSRI